MNSDPTRNTVVFQLQHDGDDLAVVADAPTRDEDCVAQAWQKVQLQHHADPAAVSALLTEWEPSEQDQQFIRQTLPGCQKVQFNFARPSDPRQWDEAFEAARRSIQEALQDHQADPARQEQEEREEAIRRQVREAVASRKRKAAARGPSQSGKAATGGDGVADQLRRMEAQAGGKLLPVLLGRSSPRGSAMLDMGFLVCQPLVPERVYVALALTGPTPHGTIGLNWFARTHHQQLGEPPFGELLEFAGANLKQGLRGSVYGSDHGPLITLERDEYLAGSAVALPDFYDETSKRLLARRLIVGIACADYMTVADADSGNADGVHGWTLEGGNDNDFLGPTVLLVERTGVQLLAERQL